MNDLEAAIEVGPHISALDPEAMDQLQSEVKEKEVLGQAKVVLWDDIKRDLPKALKVSCIAIIPHKSRKFWGHIGSVLHNQADAMQNRSSQ